jgi:hypothetical protein
VDEYPYDRPDTERITVTIHVEQVYTAHGSRQASGNNALTRLIYSVSCLSMKGRAPIAQPVKLRLQHV